MLNYFIQVIRAGLSEALLVAHTALLELCLIEFDNKKQNFTLLSYVVEQNWIILLHPTNNDTVLCYSKVQELNLLHAKCPYSS